MKLGIKTTDGVSRLKIKTTDEITKAVVCACCGCDPDALWGPGYDTQPNTINVLGQTLTRANKCSWVHFECWCNSPTNGFFVKWGRCTSEGGDYCNIGDFGFSLEIGSSLFGEPLGGSQVVLIFNGPYGPNESGQIIWAIYERTGGTLPAPYGTYTKNPEYDDDNGADPETIIIQPPQDPP